MTYWKDKIILDDLDDELAEEEQKGMTWIYLQDGSKIHISWLPDQSQEEEE